MPRLLINPGAPDETELELKPGVNSIGRNPGCDFQVPNPSISGRHCEFIVTGDSTILKDLGSTNGTFVDGSRVGEAVLKDGQIVRLGDVEMRFYAVEFELVGLAEPCVPGTLAVESSGPRLVTAIPEVPRPVIQTPVQALGSGKCKHHPKAWARFLCPKCQQNFCDLCVSQRPTGGVQRKVCRHCGTECLAVQPRLEPEVEKGFFEQFAGAFAYPVRGVGILIVIVGIVLFALINWGQACIQFRTVRLMIFGTILVIFAGGYLFTYLQCIIHSTTAGDRELPELPGIGAGSFADDVLMPFFRLFALLSLCFGPALGCLVWFALERGVTSAIGFSAALGFGCIYFPMAFLAVAVLDSIAAANPLLVGISILKSPVEYLVAIIVFGSAFGVRALGDMLIGKFFPEGAITHGMGALFALMGSTAVISFLSLYLLIVAVHLLGLLYVTQKKKLAWLER